MALRRSIGWKQTGRYVANRALPVRDGAPPVRGGRQPSYTGHATKLCSAAVFQQGRWSRADRTLAVS